MALFPPNGGSDALFPPPAASGVSPGSLAWGSIGGSIASQADLKAALDGKAAASHGHVITDVTGLQTSLDGKAAISHSHAAATTSADGFLSAADKTKLDGIAAGAEVNQSAFTTIAVSGQSNVVADQEADTLTLAAGSGITITTDAATDTVTIAASGGADPWTFIKLGTDFTTTSATAVDVTGLAFTPAANKQYIVEGFFLTRTATATVGPRVGCAWPTGLSDGAAMFSLTSSATANVYANGNINAAVLLPVGGLPNTTQSWPGNLQASFTAGASPTGTFKIQFASETAGTTVTLKAGSWIRYRTI